MVSINQNEPSSSSAVTPNGHPVATIMPGIVNPVAYHAANSTNILDGSDDSDDEVSVHCNNLIGAFIESTDSIVTPPPVVWIFQGD